MAIILTQGFENGGIIPSGWTDSNVSGTSTPYTYVTGGHSSHPAAAHTGTYNALGYKASTTPSTHRLETPKLNLTSYGEVRLYFWHTQEVWVSDQDELRVYYKTGSTGSWTIIPSAVFTSSIVSWTEESFLLPNTSASTEYQVGFEANMKYGYGVAIDDVLITAETLSTNSFSVNPNSLSGFTYLDTSGGPSTAQSFILSENGIYNTATIGTDVGTTELSPFTCSFSNYARNICLYTSEEIGVTLPTLITNIAFSVKTSSSSIIPAKVYLKTTAASTLTLSAWSEMIAGATLVYDGSLQFPDVGWNSIDIDNWVYTGSNLMVLTESNLGSTTTKFEFNTTSATTRNAQYVGATISDANTTYNLSDWRPNTQITTESTPLVSGITAFITPSSGYEVSFDSSTNYQTSGISISNYLGDPTTIYTRLRSGLVGGSYSGNISITGNSISSALVSLDGTVILTPITHSSNIISNSIGTMLLQSGVGYPTHSAPKGSLYTDTSSGQIYINKNGGVLWAYLQGVAYGELILPTQATVTLTLTNANQWYSDTNTTWYLGEKNGVSGTTNGRLYVQPNRGGIYNIFASGSFGVTGSSDDFDLGIMINGTTVPNNLWKSYDVTITGSQYCPVFISGYVNLNDNDYINLAIRNPGAAGTTTRIREAYLFLQRIKDGSF